MPAQTAKPRPDGLAARAVLIVDDDDDLSSALARFLTGEGYRVRRAADGDEGLRMALDAPPDLILLDFMMPVKNGFDALHEIRCAPTLAKVPVLALTAFGQSVGETHGCEDIEKAGLAGALEKPFEPNVLLARVAAVLDGCEG